MTIHDLMNWRTLFKAEITYFDVVSWCLHGGMETSVLTVSELAHTITGHLLYIGK